MSSIESNQPRKARTASSYSVIPTRRQTVCCAWHVLLPLLSVACFADDRFQEVPASICASTEIWTYADKDSPLMNPGRSCVQCHAETDDPAHAPLYTVAGTVMTHEHEADDCRGAAGMTVILTDATGKDWTMTANTAGNFWLDPDADIVPPYTARIVDSAGRERVKQTPVSEGDCASCHSKDGSNGAPGRLLPPEADD